MPCKDFLHKKWGKTEKSQKPITPERPSYFVYISRTCDAFEVVVLNMGLKCSNKFVM